MLKSLLCLATQVLLTACAVFNQAVVAKEPSRTTNIAPLGVASHNSSDSRSKTPSPSAPLWSSDFESASVRQWEESNFQSTPCGGEYSGEGGTVSLNQQIVHGGVWSLKMTIPGSSNSSAVPGARMHRWCESQRYRELYYSVWYFVPRHYTVEKGGWLNWFQFKSKRPNGANDPFFFLDIKNDLGMNNMKFMLTWWGGHKFSGPQENQQGYRTWVANDAIPIGRWFHIEAKYVCAGDFSGAIQIWQDGKQIFHLDRVRTRHGDGDCQWGVNNYGTGVSPSPVTIFIDDAAISTTRLGPTGRRKD